MKRSIIISLTCVLILLACLTGASAYAQSVVTDWRTGDEKGHTRFVLDLMDIAEYKAFSLNNPDRIVIDIAGSTWSAPRHKVKDALIKAVRHGMPSSNTLRIVLDLSRPATIKDSFFILPDSATKQHRLVLNIQSGVPDVTAIPPRAATLAYAAPSASDVPLSMRQHYAHKAPAIPLRAEAHGAQKPAKKTKKKTAVRGDKPVIIIDAGHGGIDPGAIGKGGRYEKDITLRYADALCESLEKTGRYTVVMTRPRDTFISLNNRVARARKAKADLFISLHADSNPDPHVRGLSVYTISENRAEREAHKLENDPSIKRQFAGLNLNQEHPEVQQVLIDMVQRETNNTSADFAEILVKELGSEAQLLKRTHRFGSLAVLTNADIPSVLVELGYLSNRYEERLLATAKHRARLVKALADAVDAYFNMRSDI